MPAGDGEDQGREGDRFDDQSIFPEAGRCRENKGLRKKNGIEAVLNQGIGVE